MNCAVRTPPVAVALVVELMVTVSSSLSVSTRALLPAPAVTVACTGTEPETVAPSAGELNATAGRPSILTDAVPLWVKPPPVPVTVTEVAGPPAAALLKRSASVSVAFGFCGVSVEGRNAPVIPEGREPTERSIDDAVLPEKLAETV